MALHKPTGRPAQERAEALRLAAEHGAAEASRRCGVPAATIRSWRQRAGESGPPAGVDRAEWGEMKEAAARGTWEAAQDALAKVRELLADGKTSEAKNAALTMAIALDKSLVLEAAAVAASQREVTLTAAQARQIVAVLTAFLRAVGVVAGPAVRALLAELLRQAGQGDEFRVGETESFAARAEIRAAIDAPVARERSR